MNNIADGDRIIQRGQRLVSHAEGRKADVISNHLVLDASLVGMDAHTKSTLHEPLHLIVGLM